MKWLLYWLTGLLFLLSLIVFQNLVMGSDLSEFKEPYMQRTVCVGLFMWAVLYYLASETAWKLWFGLAKIAAAQWSNWHQVGKIGLEGWHNNTTFDRMAFLVAGSVFITSGIKDVVEGYRILKKRDDSKVTAKEKVTVGGR
jgi:hypothetical protein